MVLICDWNISYQYIMQMVLTIQNGYIYNSYLPTHQIIFSKVKYRKDLASGNHPNTTAKLDIAKCR